MKNKKIKGVVTTLALAGSLYAASASAGPIVNIWDYTIDSGFSKYICDTGNRGCITQSDFNTNLPSPPAPGIDPFLPTHLQWGRPDATGGGQQSAFRVGNELPVPGSLSGKITTNAAPIDTVKIDHDNFPISGNFLVDATLHDRLKLTASDPANLTPEINFLDFDFHFKETLNETPCVAASPTDNPCNDIFVVDVAGAGFDPSNNSLNQPFDYDGNDYIASVFIRGLGVLSDAECADVGQPKGCQGFTTIENQKNTFQVAFAITTPPPNGKIPEPSVLLLFGAGLCAMGWMKSRRRHA